MQKYVFLKELQTKAGKTFMGWVRGPRPKTGAALA
jgi:hypothetical protein